MVSYERAQLVMVVLIELACCYWVVFGGFVVGNGVLDGSGIFVLSGDLIVEVGRIMGLVELGDGGCEILLWHVAVDE